MSNSASELFYGDFYQESAQSSIYAVKIPCTLTDGILTNFEQKQLKQYSYPKRQNEWIAGRIAAKMATRKLLENKNQELELNKVAIKNRDDGRPFVGLPEELETRLDLSISHSKEYGIAIASKDACGIDIQMKSNTLERVENRFCDKDEFKILKDNDNKAKLILLTKLWAAKEAAKKAASICHIMLGFNELKLLSITQKGNIGLFNLESRRPIANMPKTYQVSVKYFEEYALAVCTVGNISTTIWEKKNA